VPETASCYNKLESKTPPPNGNTRMDREKRLQRLSGCYVTIPTMFRDDNMELDLPAQRRVVRFLIDSGIDQTTGSVLSGGAAGDFSTMSIEERVRLAETVVEEADGKIAVVLGAQTTSTRDLIVLAQAAERIGAEFIQVSAPFYFNHTRQDFYEYVRAGAEAADVGIVLYNTFWTSCGLSVELLDQLIELPNFVGLKLAMPANSRMEYERMLLRYASGLCIIDNQLQFVTSHMLGARGIELHICNYWPQFGVRLWQLLEQRQYVEAHAEMMRVVRPYYELWEQMEKYTDGDGYLDKLCLELVGLDSSRCRPPTRDVREKYREQTRQMLIQSGVPGVQPGVGSAVRTRV